MLVIAASIATATFKLAFVGLLFAFALIALLVQTGGRAWAKVSLRRHAGLCDAARPCCPFLPRTRARLPTRSGATPPVPDLRASRARTRPSSCPSLSQSGSRGDRPAAGGAASHGVGLDVPSLPVASRLGVIGAGRRRLPLLILLPVALMALGLLVEARGLFPLLRFGSPGRPSSAEHHRGAAHEIARGASTVSLYLRPRDLHDPATGIIASKANKMKHGPEWERPGWVSFFRTAA